ncbi:uncharacterized protein RCH25_008577 [Pelodytes ibericus]
MNSDRNQMTETILNLTLEIIYLLTGEEYIVVKKSGERVQHSNSLWVSEILCRTQGSSTEPPPDSFIHDKRNEKKILDLTNKIIQLLTGEEWEYLEGHKDLYKDVMMETHQALISLDGSVDRIYHEGFNNPISSEVCFNGDKTDSKKCLKPNRPRKKQKNSAHCGEDSTSDVLTDLDIYTFPEQTQTDYSCTNVKVESASHEGGDLTCNNNIYASKEHTLADYTSIQRKEEASLCGGGGNLTDIFTPMEKTHIDYISTFIKVEPTSWENETLPFSDIYGAADLPQTEYTPIRIKEEPTSWEEDNVSYTNMYTPTEHTQTEYTSTHIKVESASPEGGTLTDMFTPTEHTQTEYTSRLVDHSKGNQNNPKTDNTLVTTKSSEFDKSMYASQQKTHATDRIYNCSVCQECFTSNSDLVKHQTVHRAKKISCTECGKFFTRISHLVVHRRIHTGEKPFSCSDCGKCFCQISHLVIHQRIHTGEKPFSCFKCGKCFTQSSHLVKHQRIHT